jgi:hypothetical protein
MHEIVESRKMENGIVVFWMEGNDMKYESFNYQELQDMKINALDLLDRARSYRVDPAAHTVIVKK